MGIFCKTLHLTCKIFLKKGAGDLQNNPLSINFYLIGFRDKLWHKILNSIKNIDFQKKIHLYLNFFLFLLN